MKKLFHRRKNKEEEYTNEGEYIDGNTTEERGSDKRFSFRRKNKDEDTDTNKKKSKWALPVFGNILIIGVGTVFTVLYFSYTELIIFVLILAIFDYWLYSSRAGKKQSQEELHSEEFVSLLTYIQIYIVNGINVYQSFQLSEAYLSDWMRDKVDRLLSDIDQDKTVEPFLNFASNFTEQHYEDILIVLYQMVDQGNESTYMSKFLTLFTKLNEDSRNASFEKNQRIINSASSFPMIGTAVFTICLTFGIISMLGDMMSVL
ncbi:MAG: hypothetical protein LUB56_00610 [Coprobacillus sp.]|nr:hypothetical protein [Coprobacillus sp.]